MTEDEAKQRWCPFVRMSPRSAIDNRGSNHPNPGNVNCIGSACMAWRATDNEIKANPESPVEHGRARDASDYVSAGYCGLAGK